MADTESKPFDVLADKRDMAAIDGGVWKDIPGSTTRILVRGMLSSQFREAHDAKARKIKANDRDADGNLTVSAANRIRREAMAEAGLLNWENLSVGGADTKFSLALAREFIVKPDYPGFYSAVFSAMAEVDETRAAEEAAVEKN